MRTPRQERERAYWGNHAQTDEYAAWREFPYEDWRTYRPIQQTALDYLGSIAGKRLLLAGVGPSSVLFARAGAEVWGFDISERQVEAVQGVVNRHHLSDSIHLAPMAFESLEFPDAFFDVAFGEAILHHIELDRGGAELGRVLRPGGRASFIEPLGTNPALQFARKHVPYPGKGRTEDERPLVYRDVKAFTHSFATSEYREFGLFSALSGRFVENRSLSRLLDAGDERILKHATWMRALCQMIWVGVETRRA